MYSRALILFLFLQNNVIKCYKKICKKFAKNLQKSEKIENFFSPFIFFDA